MKDAAWDLAEDLTQDVAEDVLGAAEDGSMKVLIVVRATFKQRNLRLNPRMPPPALPLGDT